MKQEKPKKNKAYVEDASFEKADYKFIPKGDCCFKQQGPYLVCQTCELKHSIYIGNKKMMVGEKNGKPILVSLQTG